MGVAARVEDGHARIVLLDAHDAGRGAEFDSAGLLRAFEQRGVHVGAVNHRIRVAEPRAKRVLDGDGRHLSLVERIHHDEIVDVHRSAARALPDAERVERGKGVGPELDAGADLADLRGLFEHRDLESLSGHGQRGREPADAAARNQNPLR